MRETEEEANDDFFYGGGKERGGVKNTKLQVVGKLCYGHARTPPPSGSMANVRRNSRMRSRKEAFIVFFALALLACFAANHAEARVEARLRGQNSVATGFVKKGLSKVGKFVKKESAQS